MINEPVNYLEIIVKQLINFIANGSKNRLKNEALGNVISYDNGFILLNTHSQFPLYNGIFNFAFDEHSLNKQLEDSVKIFSELKLPFTWWWLNNIPIPEKIDKQLEKMGFATAGTYSGITCKLDEVNFSENKDKNIQVRQVANLKDYDIFSNILSETFQLSEAIALEFKLMLNPLSENSCPFSNYIGYYQNEPVGSLTLYEENDFVGLYAGATLPKARNKGVARALAEYALQIAVKKGYKQAIAQLMAKNMAAGICERLGFKTVCHFIPYIYESAPNSLEP